MSMVIINKPLNAYTEICLTENVHVCMALPVIS